MRLGRLLVVLSVLFVFSDNLLRSQTATPVFSKDSLKGFDELTIKQELVAEGFSGQGLTNALTTARRNYVIYKYDLYAHLNAPFNYIAGPGNGGGKYSSNVVANAPCVNEDFETGTLTGWTTFSGSILGVSSQVYPNTPTSISAGPLASVVTTPFVDTYVGTIPASPLGGNRVVRINNNSQDAGAVKFRQTFSVTPSNYLFDFAYWAVMEDAGSSGVPHNCTQTPYMLIKIFDNNGNPQSCPVFSIVAPASGTGGCAGLGPLTWSTVNAGGLTLKTSNGWQKFSIDLTPYLATAPFPYNNVTIEVIVADCNQGGHFGYAYFDSHCNTMDLSVNGVLWSMPSTSVTPQVLCGGTATMVAPAGLGPYSWSGPTGSSSSQTLITNVPGNYTLNMNPAYICNTISKVVTLQFVPPTTVSASPANICTSGSNTSAVLSAAGAAQYTWMPGGSNSGTITVSPATTTIYTLSARTGTCLGTYTVQVTVNPDPVFNVVSSNANVCPGQTATLTAIGAASNSYAWNPGALSGSVVSVSQVVTTTYTTIATSSAGCTSSVTTTIGTSPAPPVSIFPATVAPVCKGMPVNVIGVGAPSFTWQPGNITGIFQTFTPTITTTYTAIGASGSCTNSAMITVTVDPGPSMTLTALPAITCPGNTTTLSVVAPSAVGAFTWNPGPVNASSIVVTPTLAGGYSVSAVNSNGCINTQTINPVISPLPVVLITPAIPTVCAGGTITLNATGALNYTWMPGNTNGASAAVSPTSTTAYTVIGANGAGCVSQATVNVTVVPLPTISAVASPTAVCAGSCATITPSGNAVSYIITGNSFVVCPASNTVYTIIGQNASGCSSTPVTVSVNVNSNPVLSVTASPANICPGASSTLTASGALTYTWSTGSNAAGISVSPSSTQVYTVSGTNASGCTTTTFVTLTVDPSPTVTVSPATPTVCAGGSVLLSAFGATSYTWMPGNTNGATALVSPATNTTYTITGRNAAGCVSQTTVAVTVVPVPTLNAVVTPTAVCAGGCVTITPGGAVSYSITGASFVVCPASNTVYAIIGQNAAGCLSAPINVSVNVNSNPVMNVSASPATICAGGSSTLTASGAVSYTWSTGSNAANISVSPSSTQTYTVTGANAAGCTTTTFVTVTVDPSPVITISPATPTVCAGGTVTLSALGATNYTWIPGNQNGASVALNPSVTTTYTVTGSSAAGCGSQATVAVIVVPVPTINATASPTAVCAGGCATITPGGAVSYTITGNSFVVCPASNTVYTIIGQNGAGCLSAPVNVAVNVNSSPLVNASASPATICPGQSSNLSASGAVSYTWSTGSNAANISVTPSSTQTYTVTGANAAGCTTSTFVTVTVNPIPVITINPATPSLCAGSSANLVANGATNYTWQPGGQPGNVLVVSPSASTSYTVTGESGGCSNQASVMVTVIPMATITAPFSPATVCAGSCATLNPSGAGSYTINGLTNVACPVTSTSYTVTGNGPGGCPAVPYTGTLQVLPLPSILASASNVSICPGDSSLVSATGGITYTWQPGNVTASSFYAKPTVTTVYTVSGENASGCIGKSTVAVNVIPVAPVTAAVNPTAICVGETATLSASGSANYMWMPGGLSGPNVFVSPTVTTIYTLTGNTGGCNASATVQLVVNPIPTVNINASSNNICAGASASISLSGATTYSWNDGSNAVSRVLTPAATTSYTITGFGPTGCQSLPASITITVGTNPTINASSSPTAICSGGTATLVAGGATNYTWMPGNQNGPVITVNPSSTTNYTVTATGAGGCSGIATVTVFVSSPITVTASASQATICAGDVVTLNAGGATNYTWNPSPLPSASSITVSPSASTVYTVTGTNGGCFSQATVAVNVNSTPTVNISASSLSLCAGDCATLTASGAPNYAWSTGNSGATEVVCPSGTTTYTLVGSIGTCLSAPATVSIVVYNTPSFTVSSSANPICAGSSAVLNAVGATNYTWSTGSLLPSITVAPPTTSVYTVAGSNGGCSLTQSYTLTVVPASTITITPSSPTICAGFTVGLMATGVPTVNWLPVNSTMNPLVDTPLASTVYTAVSNAGGCTATATVAITVDPAPSITLTSSPPSICPGGTITLTASGANSYTWIPGLQGGSTFTDAPLSTTVYTVVGISAAGCPGFTTATVSVQPVPVLTINASSTTVCPGKTVTLTVIGAINYTWLPSMHTGSDVAVTPLGPTTYTVIGDNGGCSVVATIFINATGGPTIAAVASTASICPGNTVQLFANGGVSYTWTPPMLSGATVTDNPFVSTTYTVIGEDAAGCAGTATVDVFVSPMAGVTAVASPSDICEGSTTTLTANGALSYTWNPGGQTVNVITVTPSVSTVYTLQADDGTCIGSFTVPVKVIPNPTVVISPSNPSICLGTSATLTASGASNYTWFPSGTTSSVTIESPGTLTTYTVTGDNGGICFSTATVDVFVNPLPQNVTAMSNGTMSCASPTAELLASTTDTNVSYLWIGPSGYTSAVQNPTLISIWGTFSLNVIDNITGCIATATVDVPTDNSIPSVTANVSSSITCAMPVVTITAVNTTTNAGYTWSGPGGFTGTAQSETITAAGNYTIIVTDLTSSCTGSAVVTVLAHTTVPVSATITPATCNGTGGSNNDGSIIVSGFTIMDKYDLVSGTSYTGTATYATAASIPSGGVLTNVLANPSTTLAYTVRFFGLESCIKDTVLYLVPVDCSLKSFGIAKAAYVAPPNTDGSYDVTYQVIVKNYQTDPLTGIQLTENLSNTFPAPVVYSVVGTPSVDPSSALTINSSFNGSSQTNLLSSGTNSLPGNSADTITFIVNVKTNLFFVPFKNSVAGLAINSTNKTLADSSQAGYDPDPDGDGNPGNNNVPTVISFSPKVYFGITKTGEIRKSDNESFDITYTVTVHNLGNDTLRNVTLNDSLFEKTIRQPASFSIRSGPVVTGSGLVANNAYDGRTDIGLTDPSQSKLAPRTVGSVYFTINVIPGTVSSISNSAYGHALSAISPTANMVVSDTSNAGTEPDVNANGICNEASDNVPTILLIPATGTLFIPEGFSPDGDNTNDYFVIQGLPEDGNNAITVFNRWGNKVYTHANYDNSWDGRPNVSGTLGKEKLPPGTYYYVLEMKGSGRKPITGFVVIQY